MDYDPKRLALGERVVVFRKDIEREAATQDEAFAKYEAFKAELHRRFPNGKIATEDRVISVGEALEAYMRDCVRGVLTNHAASVYQSRVRFVTHVLGADTPVTDVATASTIKETLYDAARHYRSREHIQLFLRALQNAAQDGTSGWSGPVPSFKMPKRDDERQAGPRIERGDVSDKDARRLIDAAEANVAIQTYYIVIRATGMRPSELLRARREHFDFEARTLFNPKGKTKSARRYIVLHDDVAVRLADLEAYHRERGYGGPWLFPNQEGGKPYTLNNFIKLFFRVHMTAAGFARELGPGPALNNPERHAKRRTEYAWTLYEFGRHTVGTRSKRDENLKAQLGQSKLLEEYNHRGVSLDMIAERREALAGDTARIAAILPPRRRHLKAV